MREAGLVFIFGYVVCVGIATFLQKYLMKDLNPFLINFVMAIGQIIFAVLALLVYQGNLDLDTKIVIKALPLGILMPLGSILFILALSKLNVGTVSVISISYVIISALLSWKYLHESFSVTKLFGIILTLIGVSLLIIKKN